MGIKIKTKPKSNKSNLQTEDLPEKEAVQENSGDPLNEGLAPSLNRQQTQPASHLSNSLSEESKSSTQLASLANPDGSQSSNLMGEESDKGTMPRNSDSDSSLPQDNLLVQVVPPTVKQAMKNSSVESEEIPNSTNPAKHVEDKDPMQPFHNGAFGPKDQLSDEQLKENLKTVVEMESKEGSSEEKIDMGDVLFYVRELPYSAKAIMKNLPQARVEFQLKELEKQKKDAPIWSESLEKHPEIFSSDMSQNFIHATGEKVINHLGKALKIVDLNNRYASISYRLLTQEMSPEKRQLFIKDLKGIRDNLEVLTRSMGFRGNSRVALLELKNKLKRLSPAIMLGATGFVVSGPVGVSSVSLTYNIAEVLDTFKTEYATTYGDLLTEDRNEESSQWVAFGVASLITALNTAGGSLTKSMTQGAKKYVMGRIKTSLFSPKGKKVLKLLQKAFQEGTEEAESAARNELIRIFGGTIETFIDPEGKLSQTALFKRRQEVSDHLLTVMKNAYQGAGLVKTLLGFGNISGSRGASINKSKKDLSTDNSENSEVDFPRRSLDLESIKEVQSLLSIVVQNSRLGKENPEVFRNLIQEFSRAAEVDAVYIGKDEFNEFIEKNEKNKNLIKLIPNIENQLKSENKKGQIKIPFVDYLLHFLPNGYLKDGIKFRPSPDRLKNVPGQGKENKNQVGEIHIQKAPNSQPKKKPKENLQKNNLEKISL